MPTTVPSSSPSATRTVPLDVTEIKLRARRTHAPGARAARAAWWSTTTPASPARRTLPAIDDVDIVEYRRPSRYADSDRLLAFARDQFRDLAGEDLLDAVVGWVTNHVTYLSGSSLPTDGATDTLLKRRGVCRDFAHLVVALLRARDVPARLASVYAPGLKPMDFHAVAEAYIDGALAGGRRDRDGPARVAGPHRDRAGRHRHRLHLLVRRRAVRHGR